MSDIGDLRQILGDLLLSYIGVPSMVTIFRLIMDGLQNAMPGNTAAQPSMSLAMTAIGILDFADSPLVLIVLGTIIFAGLLYKRLK